jgi:hypothetical protein
MADSAIKEIALRDKTTAPPWGTLQRAAQDRRVLLGELQVYKLALRAVIQEWLDEKGAGGVPPAVVAGFADAAIKNARNPQTPNPGGVFDDC